MKLLLLHPGALGDTLLALPALQLFHRRTPRADVTLAGNLDFLHPIARPLASRLVSLATVPLHRLFASETLPYGDRLFWSSWDRIVSWTGAGDARFEENLLRANPNAVAAPWKPGPGDRRHVARIFADSLGLPGEPPLEPFRIAGEAARDNTVALHPGAGSPEKRWRAASFRALALEVVRQLDCDVVVIEGPAEPGLAASVLEGLPAERAKASVGLPVGPLAQLLAACRAFVGNDSGIAHLASACGLPAVVLFGPADPAHWAPVGDAVTSLRDIRGCGACMARTGGHTCVDNLAVPQVLSALAELLRGSRRDPPRS